LQVVKPVRFGLLLLGTLLNGSGAHAEIDNLVFKTSGDISMTLPRGWRMSEQPSYPGVVLWLRRSVPAGTILFSNEIVDQNLICSWPKTCRDPARPLAANYACAVASQLSTKKIKLGPVENGPRENTQQGFSSVWFEYSTSKRHVRQAFIVDRRRAISIMLSSPTAAARSAHDRQLDQIVRSIKNAPITPANTAVEVKGSSEVTPVAPAVGDNAVVPPAVMASDAPSKTLTEPVSIEELYQYGCE
jgi:hypothetical protein